MKKRIIAILLSISIFFFSFGLGNRQASAAATGATVIIAIGVLAWELIGVCTGMYDETAAAIGEFIESGVDGFTNPDSPFQQNWREGWNTICNKVQGWFDSGDVEIVDGKIKLTYSQIQELYGDLCEVVPQPGVKFESTYPSFFIEFEGRPYKYPVGALPTSSYLLNVQPGEAYAACFYNDEKLVLSDYFIKLYSDGRFGTFGLQAVRDNYYTDPIFGYSVSNYDDIITNPDNCFTINSPSSISCIAGGTPREREGTNCFVYTNGTLTYTPVSEVDLSDCKFGLISTTANYGGFLQSLSGHTVIEGAELDDLSNILPTEYNPSLTFPVNPDLSRPLDNQIIVSDVPGVSDLPLSDYKENLKTDIEVPSIIASKFPFCIPFDFMRFLGLLCSPPVAPVFRIPISTNPGNLGAWQGNQTVGKYLNPDKPLFEINEEIVIDLSVIPLVQPICYTCFIVGFIFLLLHITPKMIQH